MIRIAIPALSIHQKTLPLWFAARSGLFILFQSLFALVFWISAEAQPWSASVPWWPAAAILANLVIAWLLFAANRKEAGLLREIYHWERASFRKDLGIAVLAIIFALGLVSVFNTLGMRVLFGANANPTAVMFQPLPLWVRVAVLLFFPVSVAAIEMPWYFGYLMPRLRAATGQAWLAIAGAGLWFSLQHAALPLIFEPRFLLWRAFMMLPFTLFIAAVLYKRKRLLPYFMVAHFLLDLTFAVAIFMA